MTIAYIPEPYPIPTTCPLCGGKVISDDPQSGGDYRCEHTPTKCGYSVPIEAHDLATLIGASDDARTTHPHLADAMTCLAVGLSEPGDTRDPDTYRRRVAAALAALVERVGGDMAGF